MTIAIVFPGQGSEEAEMGLALARSDPSAMELLAHASDATGIDVVRALERGGRALERTEVLQPVLAAVGLAAARALEDRGVRASWTLGHSLGELVAACFSARIDPRASIELAAFRGALMARASEARPGVMAALRTKPSGLELPDGAHLALHNAPDETVISGTASAIDAVLSRARGAKLRTAGAWHSPHMEPAVGPLRARIAEVFSNAAPSMPLVGASIEALADSLVEPVRFVDTLLALEAAGARHVIVVAPSRTVRALVRRTLARNVELYGADDPASLDAIASRLGNAS